ALSWTIAMALGFPAAEQTEKPQQEPQPTQLIVSIGSTVRLQMKSKRPITRVEIDREGIIRVQPAANDQTAVLITGLKQGVVLLTLTDDNGRKESHQMGK